MLNINIQLNFLNESVYNWGHFMILFIKWTEVNNVINFNLFISMRVS